jgi:hypothetical protein
MSNNATESFVRGLSDRQSITEELANIKACCNSEYSVASSSTKSETCGDTIDTIDTIIADDSSCENFLNEDTSWERCITAESLFNVGYADAHDTRTAPYNDANEGNTMGSSATSEAAGGSHIDHLTMTIILKNLPRSTRQETLLADFQARGFGGLIDFFYLPMSLVSKANRGHAFINFTTPGVALRFKREYDGKTIGSTTSKKAIQVDAALVQGFEANYACHADKLHSTDRHGNPRARPLFFRQMSDDRLRNHMAAAAAGAATATPQEEKPLFTGCQKAKRMETKPMVPRFCPSCGAGIVTVSVDRSSSVKKAQHVQQFCHECGTRVPKFS